MSTIPALEVGTGEAERLESEASLQDSVSPVSIKPEERKGKGGRKRVYLIYGLSQAVVSPPLENKQPTEEPRSMSPPLSDRT